MSELTAKGDDAATQSAAALVASCLADLASDRPAEQVLALLRGIDAEVRAPVPRARYLRARAIAANRLGFPGDALGDLAEARNLLPGETDRRELGEILRTIALVHTWHGETQDATLILLQAVAAAGAVPAELGAVLTQAGRLNLEIGRAADAAMLLARALDLAQADLADEERGRASVNLVEALVACGRLDDAQMRIDGLVASGLSRRRRFLLDLAAMRIALARSQPDAAAQALARAGDLVEPDASSFSRIELAHAEAEWAIAAGKPQEAETALRGVIARYADREDDLAPREIAARLLQADALDALGRGSEAERTLAAALRRALARGLVGYADTVRGRIAARGGTTGAWFSDSAPIVPTDDSAARFVRRRPIASGGYGSVERAYDLELGIEIALKRFAVGTDYDVNLRQRLLDSARTEVAAASHIAHPGVARVYGMLVESSGDALVIEELVEGATLRSIMNGALEPRRALELLARLAFALAAIHAVGVVHRDVKPENIVLRGDNTPVLVDFGIASIGRRPEQVPSAGTRAYMAPQQIAGRRPDGRADLYSLGIIACELLLGRRPEAGGAWWSPFAAQRRTAGELRQRGIDGATAALIASLTARQAWRRPRAAAMVASALAAAAAGRIGEIAAKA